MHLSELKFMCLGLTYRGCWYLNVRNPALGLLEDSTPALSDDPNMRVRPVSKCGMAAQEQNFRFFGVTIGYCISGSNILNNYQYAQSQLCRNGTGAYNKQLGWFIMDVYEVFDSTIFRDSVMQLNSTTQNIDGVTTEMGSSDRRLTYNLALLALTIMTVSVATALM